MKSKYKRSLGLCGVIILIFTFTVGIGNSQDNQGNGNPKDIFEDVKPYQGSIGPDSALYGLKIAFENVGETLTLNPRAKIEKQLDNAKERIAEAKAEIRKNNLNAANRALERYREKIEVADSSVSGIAGNDSGLLDAQKRIVVHQLVLERLLEANPDIRGLENALNNSVRLEQKFELRTDRRVVPLIARERIILEDIEKEDILNIQREETEVKAEVVGNDTEVRVRVRFVSNKTDPKDIAQEILNRLNLNRDNIDRLLEIQIVAEEDLIERLRAEARIERGISEDEAEFRFPLNTTNRTGIVEGTFQKLSTLTLERIQNALEVRIKELRGIRAFNREEVDIKAEVVGNDTEVKVKVEFVSNNTDPRDIAQDILDRFNLTRDEIDNLLETEVVAREELIERLRAKARVAQIRESRRGPDRGRDGGDDRGGRGGDDGGGRGRDGGRGTEIRDDRLVPVAGMNFTEVEAEFRFPLFNTTTRAEIVEGTFQKLADLTLDRILQALEFREFNRKIEDIREEEIRREQEDRREQEAERHGANEAERGGESGRGGGGGEGRG